MYEIDDDVPEMAVGSRPAGFQTVTVGECRCPTCDAARERLTRSGAAAPVMAAQPAEAPDVTIHDARGRCIGSLQALVNYLDLCGARSGAEQAMIDHARESLAAYDRVFAAHQRQIDGSAA